MIIPAKKMISLLPLVRKINKKVTISKGWANYYFYFLGREALLDSLIRLGVKPGESIVIPAYICNSTIDPLKEFGFNICFIDVNKNMSIDSVDESIYNVDYFGGMGTCISKEIYETVGQFDRINFPHYKGDYDYAMRAGKLGIKMNAHRILQIWNDKKSSGITPSTLIGMLKMYFNEKSPFYIKRNLLFYKKHEFPPSAYINLIIRFMNNIIGHSIRILLGPTIYKYNQKYKLKQIVEP